MLKLNDLTLIQGNFQLTASLEVAAGGITAIIGPSGCGKSTLLSAIAGFLMPATGSIHWKRDDLTTRPPGDRPISVLFQDNNLFPHLTVADNVGLGLRPDLRLDTAQRAKGSMVLADVGLDGMGGRKPSALSGGQQSRAALARVLLANRPLVLLDEPFAALGPGLKKEMLALVRDKLTNAGKTVLMVTHDPADATAVADHVILVADGHASPPVPTQTLFANPPKALRDYLGTK